MKIYLAIDGKQAGPFVDSELRELISSGKFTRDTLVWKQGMPGWDKAGNVPEVADLFGAAPPPIPE
jgi:hypothetical protein